MTGSLRVVRALLLLLSMLAVVPLARAQDAAFEASAQEGFAERDEGSESPMSWLGLGVKVGFGRMGSSRLTNPVYSPSLAHAAGMLPPEQLEFLGLRGNGQCSVIDAECVTSARSGLKVAIPLWLGGDGFGWVIEPYLQYSEGARAYGAYTGPKFDIHIARPLYLGFGFGVGAAWVRADGWDYAMDIYGRVPVHLTWYLLDAFALVAEVGFGYGASGYLSRAIRYVVPGTDPPQALQTAPSMTFGASGTLDFTIGVRFP